MRGIPLWNCRWKIMFDLYIFTCNNPVCSFLNVLDCKKLSCLILHVCTNMYLYINDVVLLINTYENKCNFSRPSQEASSEEVWAAGESGDRRSRGPPPRGHHRGLLQWRGRQKCWLGHTTALYAKFTQTKNVFKLSLYNEVHLLEHKILIWGLSSGHYTWS